MRPSLAQKVDRAFETESLGLQKIVATGSEGGAAVKMGRPLATPGVGGRWLPGLPGKRGVDLVHCRERRGHGFTFVTDMHPRADLREMGWLRAVPRSLPESHLVVDVVTRGV